MLQQECCEVPGRFGAKYPAVRVGENINAVEEKGTTDMKKILGTVVALAVLAIFVSLAQAVIQIDKATIKNGQVVVEGDHAAKRANISWEGNVVTKSDRDGEFKFSTTNLPIDCVGELKDGARQLIRECNPIGSCCVIRNVTQRFEVFHG
jgi:hypothetical protein